MLPVLNQPSQLQIIRICKSREKTIRSGRARPAADQSGTEYPSGAGQHVLQDVEDQARALFQKHDRRVDDGPLRAVRGRRQIDHRFVGQRIGGQSRRQVTLALQLLLQAGRKFAFLRQAGRQALAAPLVALVLFLAVEFAVCCCVVDCARAVAETAVTAAATNRRIASTLMILSLG